MDERDARTSGERDARTSGERDARTSGERDARTSGDRDVRTSGERDARTKTQREGGGGVEVRWDKNTRHIGEEGVMARTGDDEIGSMSKDTTAVGE